MRRRFPPKAWSINIFAASNLLSCVVAIERGSVRGFQGLFRPTEDEPLPHGWASIATFTRIGSTKGGRGRALFAETTSLAPRKSVSTIDATIRADNVGGLAFYDRLGFVEYERIVGVPVNDGTPVDRVRKRFDIPTSLDVKAVGILP